MAFPLKSWVTIFFPLFFEVLVSGYRLKWYLDSGHNDKKISFLDTELIEFISIGGGLALEYNFLGIYLKSFLIFDFGFEVKNLGLDKTILCDWVLLKVQSISL